MVDAEAGHIFLCPLFFVPGVKGAKPHTSLTAGANDLPHRSRKSPLHGGLLGEVANVAERESLRQFHPPRQRRREAKDRLKEGCLAHAVFP